MENKGIMARTYDDKEYYFYTDLQSDVENVMILMGYTTHGYSLGMFKDRPEPDGEFVKQNSEKIKKKEPFIKLSDAKDVVTGYCHSAADMNTMLWHLGQVKIQNEGEVK